jgi:hypothetical protein
MAVWFGLVWSCIAISQFLDNWLVSFMLIDRLNIFDNLFFWSAAGWFEQNPWADWALKLKAGAHHQ